MVLIQLGGDFIYSLSERTSTVRHPWAALDSVLYIYEIVFSGIRDEAGHVRRLLQNFIE